MRLLYVVKITHRGQGNLFAKTKGKPLTFDTFSFILIVAEGSPPALKSVLTISFTADVEAVSTLFTEHLFRSVVDTNGRFQKQALQIKKYK